MTIEEKEKIRMMRSEGKSYGEISRILSISVNTVKSFCQRQRNICICCGKQLRNIEHKKKKKFCSDKCRYKWWAKNRNYENMKKSECQHCGKVIYHYGIRKYCSHSCYIKARFGGKDNE